MTTLRREILMKLTDLIGSKVKIQWVGIEEITVCEILDIDLKSGFLRVEREKDEVIAWAPLITIRGIWEVPEE